MNGVDVYVEKEYGVSGFESLRFRINLDFAYIEPTEISYWTNSGNPELAINTKYVNKSFQISVSDTYILECYDGEYIPFLIDFIKNNNCGFINDYALDFVINRLKEMTTENISKGKHYEFKQWPQTNSYKHPAIDKLPGLKEKVKNPVTGNFAELQRVIINLNDVQKWTVSQIADWTDTLDIDLRIQPIEDDQQEIEEPPSNPCAEMPVSHDKYKEQIDWSTVQIVNSWNTNYASQALQMKSVNPEALKLLFGQDVSQLLTGDENEQD